MAAYGEYSAHGSLLMGDLGTALLIMRLAPAPAIAEIVHARINANMQLPVRELMWGMAGSMLACIAMAEMTGKPRWRANFQSQAQRLLGALLDTADGPIWVQDLYRTEAKYLGPVHGFAGNMIPLMRGWLWLSGSQRDRIAEAVARTLSTNAWRSAQGASWPSALAGDKPPFLCQYCHGAPGMVTTFADAPFTSPAFEEILLEGASSRGLQGLSRRALAFATAPVATAMRFSSYIGEQAITLGLREPEGSP